VTTVSNTRRTCCKFSDSLHFGFSKLNIPTAKLRCIVRNLQLKFYQGKVLYAHCVQIMPFVDLKINC
jgi:hypothetical protein